MEKITGRSDDLMIVRGVNVFPTQIEELVLAEETLAPYFQCVLTRPGRLDELTVLVETHETADDAAKSALAERLAGRIKDRIGTTARIEVRDPGGIERSVGKARRVVDQRG
jgi:phenylacetate-CoA ligase